MLSTQLETRLLAELRMHARFVSLHTADPGRNGGHEVTGEFYERQPIAWDTASCSAYEIRFRLPACTVTHIGYWDRAQGGLFQQGAPLPYEKRLDEGDAGWFGAGALSLSARDDG